MLTSLALVLLLGLLLGAVFRFLKLPGLLGMLITGIILSPYALGLLDEKLLSISPDLRQFALVIILTRAGLSLNIQELKKVGRPAILMCFVPASLEILGMLLIAPPLLGITLLEAAMMGSVVAAVSPAVIVPRMIQLIEDGYGKKRSIPSLILAGASVDDVYVIVLFTAFTSLAQGSQVSGMDFVQIPVSILTGLLGGFLVGKILTMVFKKFHMRDSVKVILILGISFLLLELEHWLGASLPFSGLLAIMSIGVTLYKFYDRLAKRLSLKFNKLWVAAEIILFVLVGATVDLQYAISAGAFSIVVVVGVLFFRMFGVLLCLMKTELTMKERIFCIIAYTPKATVQAAIGGIPLAMGLPSGQKILTVAVLSILITAPFGALGIDKTYHKLLKKENM